MSDGKKIGLSGLVSVLLGWWMFHSIESAMYLDAFAGFIACAIGAEVCIYLSSNYYPVQRRWRKTTLWRAFIGEPIWVIGGVCLLFFTIAIWKLLTVTASLAGWIVVLALSFIMMAHCIVVIVGEAIQNPS